jgi:hypothetical protein
MSKEEIAIAQSYASVGDFQRAIRALQSLGTTARREDYEALVTLAAEIRDRSTKARDQTR